MQQITKLSSLVVRKIILHQITIDLRTFNLGNYYLQKTETKYEAKQKLLYVLNVILGNLKMR